MKVSLHSQSKSRNVIGLIISFLLNTTMLFSQISGSICNVEANCNGDNVLVEVCNTGNKKHLLTSGQDGTLNVAIVLTRGSWSCPESNSSYAGQVAFQIYYENGSLLEDGSTGTGGSAGFVVNRNVHLNCISKLQNVYIEFSGTGEYSFTSSFTLVANKDIYEPNNSIPESTEINLDQEIEATVNFGFDNVDYYQWTSSENASFGLSCLSADRCTALKVYRNGSLITDVNLSETTYSFDNITDGDVLDIEIYKRSFCGLDSPCKEYVIELVKISGCTDPNSHNYNPSISLDDGSCQTCSDGIQNGDETGIDCGGTACEPCPCEHPDYAGLIALYNSTNGPSWTDNTGWIDGAAGTNCDPCNWFGVECNEEGRVIHVALSNNNLSGFIPAEIGSMDQLQVISVSFNKITTVETGFGQLTNLTRLFLNNNSISSIPNDIGSLTNLELLNLSNNKISAIPQQFGGLSRILKLFLNDNMLSSLPSEVGDIWTVEELYIQNNDIAELPNEIGALINLSTLNASNNELTEIPSTLGSLTDLLLYLVLDGNNISCYPSELKSLCSYANLSVTTTGNEGLPAWSDFCSTDAGTCSDEPPCPDITLDFNCTGSYNASTDGCTQTVTRAYTDITQGVTSSGSEITHWRYVKALDVGDESAQTDNVVISPSDWVSVDQDITLTYPVGTSFINIELRNACGNEVSTAQIQSAECTVPAIRIDVHDRTAPDIVCYQNLGFLLGSNGENATVTVNDIDNNSADNCTAQDQLIRHIKKVGESDSQYRDVLTFDCAEMGDQGIVLRISDRSPATNTATCTTSVSILDDTAPTVTCKDITVTLGEDGTASITADDLVVSADDNCSTRLERTLSQSTFDCTDVGTVQVTVTVKDETGKTNSCIANVTVDDPSAYDITCPMTPLIFQMPEEGKVTVTADMIDVQVTDNCIEVDDLVVQIGLYGDHIFYSNSVDVIFCGVNTVSVRTYPASDPSNIRTCFMFVAVIDELPPVLKCKDGEATLGEDGTITIDPESIFESITGRCGIIELDQLDLSVSPSTFTCDDVGNQEVTLFAIFEGETYSCTSTVVISESDYCGTCDDGIMNGDEEGVDCGGINCEPCNPYTCYGDLPQPIIGEVYAEDSGGFTRYRLPISNWADFPSELFQLDSDLPPCGANTNASRSWVNVYSENGQYIYGFCGFRSNANLENLWFGVPDTDCPPESIYMVINDRACNINYTSELVSVWGCLYEEAHNYGDTSESSCRTCLTCDDGIMNGDETAIDCGGTLCDPCPSVDPPTGLQFDETPIDNACLIDGEILDKTLVPISWDEVADAQNYRITLQVEGASGFVVNTLVQEPSYEYESLDSGFPDDRYIEIKVSVEVNDMWSDFSAGIQAYPEPLGTDCPQGCLDESAHNYDPDALYDDDSCETCTDGIMNGDETGVDCGGALCDTCPEDIDDDGDGYTENDGDCDDTEPLIFPGSLEYLDADGDGYGDTDISRVACTSTATAIESAFIIFNSTATEDVYVLNDEDCDDSDASINPFATEIPGNTIDENCDGILESADCDHPDYAALIALYNSSDGANWTINDGWKDGAAGLDCEPCGWYGVDCNEAGRVTCLDLDGSADCSSVGNHGGNNLNGPLPEDISGLTELEGLWLDDNYNLNGAIPDGLYDLVQLKYLDLASNDLFGPISEKIGQLQQLKILIIGVNDISGSLPESMGTMTNLTNLNIYRTEVSGNLPDWLPNLTNLREIGLWSNKFSGCIPKSYKYFCDKEHPLLYGNPDLENTDFETFCSDNIGECPTPGCTDENAHNYNPDADQDDDSCETCTDGILNGDEIGVDCGGQLCTSCDDIDNDQDGYTENQGDCDDTNADINPGATEICGNEIDEDCDGIAAECMDTDEDGYTTAEGDCDDTDPSIYPGAKEICDGKDNNCNGQYDEGVNTKYYRDRDKDGYGNPSSYYYGCTQQSGYVLVGGDCDDNNKKIHPGATEICSNGIDEDCDGSDLDCYYVDQDGDGFSGAMGDCNDADVTVYPGAEEICDGIDNDCDGIRDEGVRLRLYLDSDGDGYGARHKIVSVCPDDIPEYAVTNNLDCDDDDPWTYPGAPEICGDGVANDCTGEDAECIGLDLDGDGYTTDGGDCNDNDPTVYIRAKEICDGKDNDCDGEIDEGVMRPFFADKDGDGFGADGEYVWSCKLEAGMSRNNKDCDDNNADAYPGAKEICGDGIANNCSGGDDEVCPDHDLDDDGYTVEDGDCDDTDPLIHPGAEEICGDGIDSNCDGKDDAKKVTYYLDSDGDGYGARYRVIRVCPSDKPDYAVDNNKDCDDNDPLTYPGAPEICGDGIANDCRGEDAECIGLDSDGDGYTTDGGDCDDSDPSIHPGAKEICDGRDNDCDGKIDEGALRPFFVDKDGDGYGADGLYVWACTQEEGMSRNNSDCDDTDPDIHPRAEEICGDGIDNDCKGGDAVCDKSMTNKLSTSLEINDAIDITAFPNPFTDILQVSFDGASSTDAQLMIFDVLGKGIRTEFITLAKGNQLIDMDLSQLKSGIYFLQVRSAEGVLKTERIVKH